LLDLAPPIVFLGRCLTPPKKLALAAGVKSLTAAGALAPLMTVHGQLHRSAELHDGMLTPLGFHLALLSADVRLGKLLLLGYVGLF